MMRFDLTCNIALRVEPRQQLHAHVLPAVTVQQQLLHELIWVDGCERWKVSAGPDGGRVLDLIASESEVRVAFATSLAIAPMWCHAATLWELPENAFRPPRAYTRPHPHWSEEHIVAALGRALPSPAAVFAALPEVFEWLGQSVEADELQRYARVPMESTSCVSDRMLDPLDFAVAVFRALGVPARTVAGFAPESVQRGPDDARAFALELYRDRRWWLFEPDGQVPAFGFIRTAVASEASDLALMEETASARPLRMDANVDPPPAWGLPLRTSSRLLLSLEAQDTGNPPSALGAPVVPPRVAEATWA